ncbi:MAG TPA: hypothetical protein VF682_26140 [Pseudomonas sp.]|jgi:hypothetical protein
MLMKNEHFEVLVTKVCQELSPRTRLIVMRRILREVMAQDDREKTILRMSIRAMKRRLPFTQPRLTELEGLLKDCRDANRDVLKDYGQLLRDYHHTLEASMTFDELCDVMCVNRVHRAEVAAVEKGLFAITWIGGQYEDSSTHYGNDGLTGAGPVTKAIGAAMHDFMMRNMDKMPDPFAPGGPFHGIPTYHHQPDGTLARKSASLTVHSPDGSSRVVERKLEKNNG